MALAASSLLTVTRTTSLPARARAATCLTVPGTSAVSVLVMDCTITGAVLPTRTPPMAAMKVFLRWIWAMFRLYFKPVTGKERELAVIPGMQPGCPYVSNGACTRTRESAPNELRHSREPWQRFYEVVIDHHHGKEH